MKLVLTFFCCLCALPPGSAGGYQRPTVTLTTSAAAVRSPSDCGEPNPRPECAPTSLSVSVKSVATGFRSRKLTYVYTATGGRIAGEGPVAKWDMTGVAPGVYSVKVECGAGAAKVRWVPGR